MEKSTKVMKYCPVKHKMSCQRECSISCLSMLLHIPCCDLCASCCLLFKMKNPFDAEKLTDLEAKSYIDRLQGSSFTIQNIPLTIDFLHLQDCGH